MILALSAAVYRSTPHRVAPETPSTDGKESVGSSGVLQWQVSFLLGVFAVLKACLLMKHLHVCTRVASSMLAGVCGMRFDEPVNDACS